MASVPLLCFLQSADLEKAGSLEPGSRGHEVHRGVAGLSGAQALGLAKTPKELLERSFPKTPKRPRHQVRARARLARPRPQPCEAQLPLLVSAGLPQLWTTRAKLQSIKREDRPLLVYPPHTSKSQPHPKMHLEALAYVVTNTVLLLCGLLTLDVVQIPEARNFSVNLKHAPLSVDELVRLQPTGKSDISLCTIVQISLSDQLCLAKCPQVTLVPLQFDAFGHPMVKSPGCSWMSFISSSRRSCASSASARNGERHACSFSLSTRRI